MMRGDLKFALGIIMGTVTTWCWVWFISDHFKPCMQQVKSVPLEGEIIGIVPTIFTFNIHTSESVSDGWDVVVFTDAHGVCWVMPGGRMDCVGRCE